MTHNFEGRLRTLYGEKSIGKDSQEPEKKEEGFLESVRLLRGLIQGFVAGDLWKCWEEHGVLWFLRGGL